MFDDFRESLKSGYQAYKLSCKSSKVVSVLEEYHRYADNRFGPSSGIASTLRSRQWLPSNGQARTDPSISRLPTKELLEELRRRWLPTRSSIQDSAPAEPSSPRNDLSALDEARPPDEVQGPEAETSSRVPASSSFLAWPKRQIQSIADRLKPTMSSLAEFRRKHLTSSLITDRTHASQPLYDDIPPADDILPISTIPPTSATQVSDPTTQALQDPVKAVPPITPVPPDLDLPSPQVKPEKTIDAVPPDEPDRDLANTQGEPDKTVAETTQSDTVIDETGPTTTIDESRPDPTVTEVPSDTAKADEGSSINWSRL